MSEIFDSDEVVIPDVIPLLPVRDVVVFPYMILPLFVGREVSIRAVNEALAKDRLILLSAQKDITEEAPTPESIYTVGTVAMIMRMRKLPDGRIKILAQGISKAEIKNFEAQSPYYSVRIENIKDETVQEVTIETEALMRSVRERLEKVISLGKTLSPDILMVLDDIRDPGRLSDLIVSNLGLKVSESQKILEMTQPIERLNMVNEILRKELEILEVQQKMRSQVKEDPNKNQRDYFLREQIKAIKNELGEQDSKAEDFQEIREKITNGQFPEEVRKEATKQLGRLERMHPDASEASIIRTYLDWIVELPWMVETKDQLDVVSAEKVLNEDHFGLEKVKERIVEFLAVRKLKRDMKGPILCFVGPPGVGKTSLGKSIAHALGREFVRISLGGVRDEAEIRGHRRTYVGAMPGRIVQGLKQAKVNNPVFMLDEIDKLGADFRGDPASALLEVLDPEQNFSFRDHYLNLPFDLTNVMFIATANMLDTIPAALKDRMEIIQIAGYSEEDKLRIAKQYLASKQIRENGIDEAKIAFSDEAWKKVIRDYTRESGLRTLERAIGKICRKVARSYVEATDKKEEFKTVKVDARAVEKYLGPPIYTSDEISTRDEVGIVTGLAWTEHGGEILTVEVSKMKGKGMLILTGQLGDVMKESGQAALSYVRSNAERLGIPHEFFSDNEIHIHVPAGAIPKDGPSAGIAMATALVSMLTGIAVRKEVAMTGEITLTGKVLPIGGLKEKSLAAMRQGIQTVIIPHQNIKDLVDIPKEYRKRLQFIDVNHLDEVIRAALIVDPFRDVQKRLDDAKAIRAAGNSDIVSKPGNEDDKAAVKKREGFAAA